MRSYDVVVVGAGLIGGSIALRLAQEHLRVALFDRQEPAREASWAAAGMLSPAPDSLADVPLIPFSRASLALYPDFVTEVEDLSGQRVHYRSEGTIEALFSGDAERKLSTLIALHHGLGLPTEPLPLDEARKLEPALGREVRAAALLPFEGSVDNRALTEAVLAAGVAEGVELCAHANVVRLASDAERCTGVIVREGAAAPRPGTKRHNTHRPGTVRRDAVRRDAGPPDTGHHNTVRSGAEETIAAGHVVLAAGAFSAKIAGVSPPVTTRPIRGQMVALRCAGLQLRRVLRSERGYLVPRDDNTTQRVVAGSTLEDADFEKRVTPAGLERILSAAQELVPALSDAEIVETWCGLRPDTPDHLPILGPAELRHLTVATGHYRNGILLAPITAKLVREWITESRVSMDWEIFSPLRFSSGQTFDKS
jgi:glycine oxidase